LLKDAISDSKTKEKLNIIQGYNMNLDQTPLELGCFSISMFEDQNNVIFQRSSEIHKHQVQKGYRILSKNDFGKVKKRINLGIFNKKTNFIIGEKNSLIVWDNKEGLLKTLNTSEIIEDKSRYFMLYDMNFIANFKNKRININDKLTKETIEIELNNQFGQDIGEFLNAFNNGNITEITEDFEILKAIIQIHDNKLSLNKHILINSNFEFLLGILEGYLKTSPNFVLNGNINIYNFTYILNLLGAQYSIRTVEERKKHIRFKLPIFLKAFSDLDLEYFRRFKYFFELEEEEYTSNLILKKNIVTLIPNAETTNFKELVNCGLIEMVPIKDLVFEPLEKPEIMYDLTMPNINANNYSLPGTPLMKNSDGDVLGVVAIHTKDAAEECTRKFSTELKENFLSLTNGNVNNWGVKLDSQMGLYTSTK
jgi:hypothetical protein